MRGMPTKSEIMDWIADNPDRATKRDIARAFGVKGADRIHLKRILRELEDCGHLERRRRLKGNPGRLPPVTVMEVREPDADGDLFAHPLEWKGEGPEPRALIVHGASGSALEPGDRILARLTVVKAEGHAYEARPIRRIARNVRKILGIFRDGPEGGRIRSVDKGSSREWRAADASGVRDGELVEAEPIGRNDAIGLPAARITAALGDSGGSVSLIAINQHGIPDAFGNEAISEAEAAKPLGPGGREDLRELPFVTIDPTDARDHDDACFATRDTDPGNPGGHIVWVAIADVAAYVRPGTALDAEARRRGNSTYFADRVVPMLPERLSADLCSLREDVPRACIAVELKLDSRGNKLAHRFMRAVIKSAATLSYSDVQAARDGAPEGKCADLAADVINPLFEAYLTVRRARERRQPLDLELPERVIALSDDGGVRAVGLKQRLDAHRLIEEFMILANVAAAEELFARRCPLLYRVHEEPAPERLDALREVARASGLTLAKGQTLLTRHLNSLLAQAKGGEFDELVNLSTLRAMQQAYYHPENLGHFGLALRSYTHFTSPIRRYADLIVHRALISAYGWGDDGLSPSDIEGLGVTARHISETERRSMAAERETNDRYLAAYLSNRVGDEFVGRINGIQRFGAFVRLDVTGADGLVPVRSIGREFFVHDSGKPSLKGEESGLELSVGLAVRVRLSEAVPVTGGLTFELLEVEGRTVSQRLRRHGSGGRRRRTAGKRRKASGAGRGFERRR